MDWIDLAHVRDQWRALVNTGMNFRLPENVGKFLSDWRLLEKGSAPWSQKARRFDFFVPLSFNAF
jgi:hypothetical protein